MYKRQDTVKALRARTDRHLDTHLMVADPRTWSQRFLEAGSDSVTFHLHTDPDPVDLVHTIHDLGGKVGVAVRPSERLEEAADVLALVDIVLVMTVEPGFGGQSFIDDALDTVRGCARNGADTFVAGSSVFKHDDRVAAVRAILAAADDAVTNTEVTS